MEESHIIEIWHMFKEYLDKKNLDIAAERYVDLMADYGVQDEVFTSALGSDAALDHAINYYLDLENDDVDDDEEY